MKTVNLTYVVSGDIVTQTVRWSAGEDLKFSFAPAVTTNITAYEFRLLLMATTQDGNLVDKVDVDFVRVSVANGTHYCLVESADTFDFPANSYLAELARVDDGNSQVLARWENIVDANPASLAEATVPVAYQPDWSQIVGTPTTLAGYGITDGGGGGGGGGSWGSITGTLSSQTDLQSALNAKLATAGLGTGVVTALVVNTGSAGAILTRGGDLGTPSACVATNFTGTALGLSVGNSAAAVNSVTASYLSTARSIYGNLFDGTVALTQAVGPAFGGTGVANNAASTITISGSFATTFTITGATSLTLPTSGTLATLNSPVFTGQPAAPTAAAATSTTQLATTAFVQQELATAVAGLLDFKGNIDASGNPNYSAASKGDTYYVSVAGKVGGASGKSVDIGDAVIAKVDNAGGAEASVGTSWFVLEHNLTGALLAANNLSDVASVSSARTSLGLGAGDSPTFVTVTAALAGNATTATTASAVAVGGITGLGTGSAAALAINVGGAGAFVTFNGAGGTPSSITLTNGTALPISGLTASTSAALGVGSVELGHATDSTLSRSAAGKAALEGKAVVLSNTAFDVTLGGNTAARSYTLPDADTTLGSAAIASFVAHKNGTNQTGVTAATWVKVTFTTESFDVGSYYDNTNSKWTPPAGKILLHAQVCNDGTSSSSGDFMSIAIYKNGSALLAAPSGEIRTNGEQVFLVSLIDDANGADYYEIYVFFGTGGGDRIILGNTARTRFQGSRIT